MRGWIKALPLTVGLPLLIGAASVPPDVAASNLSGWMHWLGVAEVPGWLAVKSADHWVIILTIAAAAAYSLLVWRVWVAATTIRLIHHLSLQAETKPVASVSMVLIRAYKTPLKWAHDYLAQTMKLKAGDPKIWDELRSAARSGEITVWGRPGINGLSPNQYYKPPEAIPHDHWRDFGFNEFRCLAHEDERECGTEPDESRSLRHDEKYGDLRIHEGEIRARWPS